MALDDAQWNYWSGTIGSFISAIVVSLMLMLYGLNLYMTKSCKYLQIMSLLVLFSLWATAVQLAVNNVVRIPYEKCEIYLFFAWILYVYYKGLLSVMYVTRQHSAYNSSTFALKTYSKYILWFIVCQYFIVITIFIIYEIFVLKS